MIPNITRGGRMQGVLAYLVGPGREGNEVHTEPHLVAGDPAIMAWHDDAELDRQAAMRVARALDAPRVAFGTRVTVAVKNNDGTPARDLHTGKALRKDAHVWHCSLSLPPGEGPLSDERWAAITEDFVARMGFSDPVGETAPCRWVAIGHGESRAGNDHVHVVVGLVHEDGRPAKTWNDRPRAQTVCGELEGKYGLQVLPSREAGTGTRGDKPAERERAAREPELAKEQLARTVRACAAAAGDEAEFVRRVRGAGVLIRPRYAAGRDDVVVGYSAAHRPPKPRVRTDGTREKRAAPLWYGGGHLARDLTLPRLRTDWPNTPGQMAAAVAEWRAAKRHQPVVSPGVEATTRTYDPELWSRYTSEVAALREQLRNVPVDDRALWAQVARETAGAFAAWSQRVEPTPGPLAATADVLARSAQLRAHQVRPRPAAMASARGAALLLGSVAIGGRGTVAEAILLRQLANTIKALHDAHHAAGDARRAAEIRDVVINRLTAVHDALPQPAAVSVAGGDRQGAEAQRVATQGQLPARAPQPPVPGSLDAPRTQPAERPGVQRPDRNQLER